MYKEDLALNNLQWLICHKTQQKRSYQKCLILSPKPKKNTQFSLALNPEICSFL